MDRAAKEEYIILMNHEIIGEQKTDFGNYQSSSLRPAMKEPPSYRQSEPDIRRRALLDERELHLTRLAELENELWEEFGLAPAD